MRVATACVSGAMVALSLIGSPASAWAPRAVEPVYGVLDASPALLLAAMQPERDYDASATTNSGRFQAAVYLRLARLAERTPGTTFVAVRATDWYQAFLEYSQLTDEEAPDYLRLMRRYRQDALLDLRPDAVIQTVKQGRRPDLAMNVRLAFADDVDADSFSYEDRQAEPAVLVHNDRVVTYRLMDFGDQVLLDDIRGSKVRPLTGSLGALFAVIGLAEIRTVRMAVAEDGTTVTIATARKAIVSVPAAVTTSPWGRTERGVPAARDDLVAIEQRLRQPLEFEYVEMDWRRAVALARAADGDPLPLQVDFIGNMAMRITDGVDVLYTDFPYRSGASGYMEYPDREIDRADHGVALVTHGHDDHWDRQAFQRTGLQLIAPPPIAAQVDPGRVLGWAESIRYGGIEVHPVPTPHTDGHVSYRVLWGGRRLYFSGDTDSTEALAAQHGLDAAFVSPWLLRAVRAAGQDVDARLIVIYHHLPDEELPRGPRIHVPTQRGSFVIR